jgi:hypothetical protein
MARKPKPPKAEPKSWSSLDDVEYDDDEDGAQPTPDDDGNVVLKRSTPQKEEQRGKKTAGRKPRR